jgi:hypothetical protein
LEGRRCQRKKGMETIKKGGRNEQSEWLNGLWYVCCNKANAWVPNYPKWNPALFSFVAANSTSRVPPLQSRIRDKSTPQGLLAFVELCMKVCIAEKKEERKCTV